MIFVAKGVFCQIVSEKTTLSGGLYSLKPLSQLSQMGNNSNISPLAHTNNKKGQAMIPLIAADNYSQNFGFFCKKELQLEKVTGVPFKFRLGTVQYCDWMEGKPNSIKPF